MSHTIAGSNAKVLNIHSISILKVDVTRNCWFWYIYDGCAFIHSLFTSHWSTCQWLMVPHHPHNFNRSMGTDCAFLGSTASPPLTASLNISLVPPVDLLSLREYLHPFHHFVMTGFWKIFSHLSFPPPAPNPLMTHKSFHNNCHVTPFHYCGKAHIWVSY